MLDHRRRRWPNIDWTLDQCHACWRCDTVRLIHHLAHIKVSMCQRWLDSVLLSRALAHLLSCGGDWLRPGRGEAHKSSGEAAKSREKCTLISDHGPIPLTRYVLFEREKWEERVPFRTLQFPGNWSTLPVARVRGHTRQSEQTRELTL